MPRKRRAQRRGFTLIEAAMTTVIIGVGVVAMVDAQQAFLRSNNWSSQASSGAFLANEIREMTRFLPKHDPVTGLEVTVGGGSATLIGWGIESNEFVVDDFDDIDDFDGLSFSYLGSDIGTSGVFSGPINGFGEVIPEIDIQGDVALYEFEDETNPLHGQDMPMQGWVQTISVEPIMPFDTSDDLTLDELKNDTKAIGVETYPLRVTVTITYQDLFDPQPQPVTELQWIVP